jgi:outer membrane lipoprotein-sorting protein
MEAPVDTALLTTSVPDQEQAVAPEARRVLEAIDKAGENVRDMEARVSYLRAIPLLDEVQRSRGKLVFRKPDLLALELGKPREEEIRSNGKTWWVVSHGNRLVEVFDASPEAGREAAFLQFGYGKGSEVLLKEYGAELVSRELTREGDQEFEVCLLRFVPREHADRPARYAAVEVQVSSKDWLPRKIVLHESGGEVLHTYELSRLKLNTDVPLDDFEYDPPAGYTVRRPEDM